MDTIAVVTPTFNSEAFLDSTIASVVTQPGDFRIHYHIQDGGSTDGTLEIIRRWQRLLNQYPISCGGIEFTMESLPDRGMYDAINKGFAHIDLSKCPYMTWINSDDLLAPGALATVMAIKQDASVSWMTGRSALINAQGSIIDVFADHTFSRADLEAGLYDGRGREDGRYVMQEGTFWMPWLWESVGGVESGFKLAADWHLWRGFAAHAPLTSVRTVLGFHRKRPGQLSGDIAAYHAEVDKAKGDWPTRPGHTKRERRTHISYDISTARWRLVGEDHVRFKPAIKRFSDRLRRVQSAFR